MRERLFDLASVLVHQNAPFQTFLSTGAYLFQTSTGILIPLTAFHSFSEENDTLTPYLSRPMLNYSMIDELIAKDGQITNKKKLICALRNRVNVKSQNSKAYWERTNVIALCSPYCTTYAAMSVRYATAKAVLREKERDRKRNMSPGAREEKRLRDNANKTKNLKRTKAEKAARAAAGAVAQA